MPFTIPNSPSASFPDQSAPDKVDFDIVTAGSAGTGVVSGCAVTAQATPDMSVDAASGWFSLNGGPEKPLTPNAALAIGAADATNPRFDLITADYASTNVAVTAGTPAATAVFPAIPAGSVVLAAVYIPVGTTGINSARIVDKRVTTNTKGRMYSTQVGQVAFKPSTEIRVYASVAGLTASNLVMVTQGAALQTDENHPDMDDLTISGRATNSGEIEITITSPTPISGIFRVNYMIGA